MAPEEYSQSDLLEAIGIILIALQAAEKSVNFALIFVFQDGNALTLEKIERLKAEEKSRTLGRLLGQLKRRVELAPDFEEMLSQFLDDRNVFIHRIDDTPGFDLTTSNGRKAAAIFLSRLYAETKSVLHIFFTFIRAWQEQLRGTKFEVPEILATEWPFLEEIEKLLPVVETYVGPKKESTSSLR